MNGPEIVNPGRSISSAGKMRSTPSIQNMNQSGCALLPTSPGMYGPSRATSLQGTITAAAATSPPTHSSSVVDSANCIGHSGLPVTHRCPSIPCRGNCVCFWRTTSSRWSPTAPTIVSGRMNTCSAWKRGITLPVGNSPPKIQKATLSPMKGSESSSE